jgi:hypothetical protein
MTWMDEQGNIYHVRGDDFKLSFTDFKENDRLINWSGWNILLQVREKPSSDTESIEFKNPKDIDLLTDGVMIIKKPHDDFDLIPKTYVYDLQATRPDNSISTWLNNKKFFVLEDIAR